MERALRTLGMALHVAGDAYAHKAVIPDQITFPSDMNKELSKSIQDHGIKTDKKEKFKIERKGLLPLGGMAIRSRILRIVIASMQITHRGFLTGFKRGLYLR